MGFDQWPKGANGLEDSWRMRNERRLWSAIIDGVDVDAIVDQPRFVTCFKEWCAGSTLRKIGEKHDLSPTVVADNRDFVMRKLFFECRRRRPKAANPPLIDCPHCKGTGLVKP